MTSAARILFVDHAAVLGGAELSLLDIATAFRDRAAVALFEDGPFAAALVRNRVAVIPLGTGGSLRSIKKDSRVPSPSALIATVRSIGALAGSARRFDALYANSPKSFLIAAGASVLAQRPVFWHLRDILDRSHFSASNIRLLVTVANARAACVIANSRATADAFASAGGRSNLVRVVHNGIDAAPFQSLDPSIGAEVRASLRIPQDAFVVGSFSRLHPWKGQRVLLEALELLPDVHGLIVGGALFSGEQGYQNELRERAARPPLAGRVLLLGSRNDVPELLAACDVVAHTSVAPEPFGRVLVEALLARRALVASSEGGVREVVQDGVTALLVAPGDARALANAIARLRDNRALARELADAGWVDVRKRFTREAMLEGVTRAIDETLAGRR